MHNSSNCIYKQVGFCNVADTSFLNGFVGLLGTFVHSRHCCSNKTAVCASISVAHVLFHSRHAVPIKQQCVLQSRLLMFCSIVDTAVPIKQQCVLPSRMLMFCTIVDMLFQ